MHPTPEAVRATEFLSKAARQAVPAGRGLVPGIQSAAQNPASAPFMQLSHSLQAAHDSKNGVDNRRNAPLRNLAGRTSSGHKNSSYWGRCECAGLRGETHNARRNRGTQNCNLNRILAGHRQYQAAYLHSQILAIVLPAGSTSYSNAPQAWLRRASFCEAVLKNNMPR
jgi:hypothetical protein